MPLDTPKILSSHEPQKRWIFFRVFVVAATKGSHFIAAFWKRVVVIVVIIAELYRCLICN